MIATRIASAALAASWLIVAPAIGDDDAPREAGFEERVLVQADAPSEDAAAFATVIEAEALAASARDLADVLRRLPSARVRQYSGTGRTSTISLRGSTSEQVTVLVDGIPQNRAYGGAVDLSSIASTQIERITVYRGFPPASLGLDGLGGLVDIRTRAPTDEPSWSVDLLAGSFDTQRASLSFSEAVAPRVALRVGGEHLRSDGDFEYLDTLGTFENPGDDRIERRRNNDLEATRLSADVAVDDVLGGRIVVQVRTGRREQGVPGVDSEPSPSARLRERDVDAVASWSSTRDDPRRGDWDLRVDLFEARSRFENREGTFGIGASDLQTDIEGGGFTALHRWQTGRHALLARVEHRREEARVTDDALELSDRGGARRETTSVVVEDVARFGRVTLAPSVRWMAREDRFVAGRGGSLPAPAEDVDDEQVAAKLGVAVQLGGGFGARASYGRFERVPSLFELFGDGAYVLGNPRLDPETGTKWELGGTWTRELARGVRVDAELVAFGSRTDDLILLEPTSPATAKARNVARAAVDGVEAFVGLSGWRGISVALAGTLQAAEDRSRGPRDGEPLAGVPERSGSAQLAWADAGWDAAWDAIYVGENAPGPSIDDDQRLPSRVLHDLRVGWTHGRSGVRIGIEVRNVFDRRTVDVFRYPLPGRSVFVSLGWRG